jgi:hypothetical protein
MLPGSRRSSIWLAVLGVGCASQPVPVAGVGSTTDVTLLDRHFVRFEGERVPVEAFVYTMRQRARAAPQDARPWVRLRCADGYAEAPHVLEALLEHLQRAGLAGVSVGS